MTEELAFSFGTKAETLSRLRNYNLGADFCDQLVLTVADWISDSRECVRKSLSVFGGKPLIVRSSAKAEDGHDRSLAGAFLSVQNVAPENQMLTDAISRVIESYGDSNPQDQILIQPMITDVLISGVVTTKDLGTGAAYYVINYDDFSGMTDTVTGGRESKLLYVRRVNSSSLRSDRFRKLTEIVERIEAVTGDTNLDIEFCIDAQQRVYVLQVRPIAARSRWEALDQDALDRSIEQIRSHIGVKAEAPRDIWGSATLFSDMTDWNPAEMIGITPTPLALGLYRSLVTDRVWCEARFRMGYRRFPHRSLLTSFSGRPYIDVRLSLNSFLPEGLADDFGKELIDFQIDKLRNNRTLHDKVEFEISATCRSFLFDSYAGELVAAGFSRPDVEAFGVAIGSVTRDLVENGAHRMNLLNAAMEQLRSDQPASNPREGAKLLLERCIPYGTLPFSMLARDGFIGVALLRSLVARGAMEEREADLFLSSIQTVAGDLVVDMRAVSHGDKSVEEFLATYGHLRPGTYDITSTRYDEDFGKYLGHAEIETEQPEPFVLSPRSRRHIAKLLAAEGYRLAPEELLSYIRSAIQGRERAKFEFTRNVSDALVAMTAWGEGLGLGREDLAFLDPVQALEGEEDRQRLSDIVAEARKDHQIAAAVRLPSVIAGQADVDVIRVPLGQPTFMTRKAVSAAPIFLSEQKTSLVDGKIVFIEGADPGYDWIFSHSIEGLVTKFGGANSHMAIRCAEFGLPAAIGCGDRLYEQLRGSRLIELNCNSRTLSGR